MIDGTREYEIHGRNAWRRLWLTAGLLALGLLCLGADLPLGRWCAEHLTPGQPASGVAGSWASVKALQTLAWALQFAELFGHGLGTALVVLGIFQLDPPHRWAIPRLVVTASLAGLCANGLKLLVQRTRPHFDSFGDLPESVWSTFGHWLPLTSAGSGGQSFPSGHTATAAALAAALVWLYPRGRWLFPSLAVLVGCQRVASGAHWTSDVLLGAAVGCLAAALCLDLGPLPRAFSRWERRWRGEGGGKVTR
jgi:membrane-associated phospholipid phosphatase